MSYVTYRITNNIVIILLKSFMYALYAKHYKILFKTQKLLQPTEAKNIL